MPIDRREFLKLGGLAVLGSSVPNLVRATSPLSATTPATVNGKADYSLRMARSLIELAPDHIVSTRAYNGQFPGPLLRFKEGRAGRRRHPQRHRYTRAVALARPVSARGCGWRRRRRHTVYSGPRYAQDRLHARADGLSLLSHASGRRRQPHHGAVQRPGRSRLYRTETRTGSLRSRSVPHPQGIRSVLQQGRRHGDGLPESL